jgi:hypothetical protein
MDSTFIGIVIATINILIILSVIIYIRISWIRSRPKQYFRKVGIRYLKGSKPDWSGMQCVIEQLYEKIGAIYGNDFAEEFLSQVIIEVVPATGSRRTPTTIVSDANRIAGSIASERQFFWSKRYMVAVVLQRPKYVNASQGAISHEIVKHLLPLYRGEGVNANHERIDLNALNLAVELACS